MTRSMSGSLAVVALAIALCAAAKADEVAQATLTKVGDPAPAFEIKTVDGQTLTPSALAGKVVVLNFFATWCGPCVAEMPHLEKQVWQKHRESKAFAMIAVGREHSDAEVAEFAKTKNLTFPFAADPERKTYAKFAAGYIPRTYVIGPDGKILFQSVGYNQQEFDQMLKVIDEALEAASPEKT